MPTRLSTSANSSSGGTRRGPFFDFKANRLERDANNNFFYYLDPYGRGQPYAYFSSKKAGWDYFWVYPGQTGSAQFRLKSDGVTPGTVPGDCPSLMVSPYMDTSKVFINPRGFQVVCAGADAAFGPGGVWDTQTGYGVGGPGSDDQSNFSQQLLGQPQG
jgi:hypothetical protein